MTTPALTEGLQTTLALFEAGGEPMTTTEVAERLDLGRRSSYDRLDRLVERGRLRSKKVGANGRVWWRPTSDDAVGDEGAPVEYERVFETVADGIYVVDEDGEFVLVNDAFCELAGYDREQLLGSGAPAVRSDAILPESGLVTEDLRTGQRETAVVELDVHPKTGDPIPCESRIQSISLGNRADHCGVVRDISARLERDHELESQREQLATLNHLHDVVENIARAAIEQSTRGQIEELVCERLAATDSFEFAWVGGVDTASQTVTLRTEAGVDGYLEGITISVDPDDELSRGPTGRAVVEQEIQTSRDLLEDPSQDPWREHLREYDVRSSAAIPILYEGTVYGVLNVYAARPDAFSGEVRGVVGQLGGIIGHAIASIQRKQALMSEEVVELAFRIPNVFAALDIDAEIEGEILLENTVPSGKDTYLVYGTATEDAMDAIAEMVASDRLPHWVASQTVAVGGDRRRFVIELRDPPVVTLVAAHGGYVEEARIEDGDYYMNIHLSPATDATAVIEEIKDTYAAANLVTKRPITRESTPEIGTDRLLQEALTERQRSAIEAAFHSGYFEWPREMKGEEVAEALGVSSPTFQQHLRNAHHAILSTFFGESSAPDSRRSSSE